MYKLAIVGSTGLVGRTILKILEDKTDRDIAITLLNLPEVIDKAYEVKSLNDIAEYLYKITSI